MAHFTFRIAAAASAFLLGLASARLSGLPAPVEARLAEWLAPAPDLGAPAGPLVGPGEDDPREVYETVLRELSDGEGGARFLVVCAEAAGFTPSEGEFKGLPAASEETFYDYDIRQDFPGRLPPLRLPGARVAFLEREEFDSMFGDGDRGANRWDDFYRKFPDSSGYVRLSPVGFNRAGDQALVHVRRRCGRRCGASRLLVLERGARGWAIATEP